MVKKLSISIFVLLVSASFAYSQNDLMQSAVVEDSTIVEHSKISFTEIINSLTDSYYGEGRIVINQPYYLANAMDSHLNMNEKRQISGYRVSIFSDNKRNARDVSQSLMDEFVELYPDIKIYRSYVAPYFKVRVGDFRTLSEAMKFLERIKPYYQSAFVVKEDHVNLID